MKQANPHLAARQARKADLLPRAAALAAEGRTYQEIAAALGVAKSTVCQWLRDRPLGRAAAKALGTPRMTAKLAARYESLYHRAVREWNRSQSDRRTETVLTIAPAGGSPTTKTTIRTEPRTGNTACLGKALAAMKAMEGLHCRERFRQECAASLNAPAGDGSSDGGVTRTVTTTMTRSGPQRRIVTTRRLGGAMPATPGMQATSGSEEGGLSCGESTSLADHDHEYVVPDMVPASRGDLRPLAGASRSDVQPDGASSGAALANGAPAKRPGDWRKAFVPSDLRLQPDDFAGVSRSATLPNDLFQKGGFAKRQKETKRNRRKARRRTARESGPLAGSADNLARELDLAFGGPGLSPG